MKTKVTVDGQNAAKKVLHLDRATVRVVVTARGDNGQPVAFAPGEVSLKLGDEQLGTGPAEPSRRAEFTVPLARSNKLSVVVGDETPIDVVLLSRRAGWLWIFGLVITLALATGLVVFQIAFMRFDNMLQRLEESSSRVIEFMTGGLAVVLGVSVVRETIAERSWTPLLRRRRFVLSTAAFVIALMLVPVRHATYANGTGGPLTLTGIPAWQPGDLRFLIGDEKKMAPPLCIAGQDAASCRTFGRRPFYEGLLARNQIGCAPWWRRPARGVDEIPSESCTRVTLVRAHPDGRSDEVAIDYKAGGPAAGAPIGVEFGDKRTATTGASPEAEKATTPPPDDVEIVSNTKVNVELRPEYASEARVARVTVAVDALVPRRIDGAMLGSRFTAAVRDKDGKKDFGRFTYVGLANGSAAGAPATGTRGYVRLDVRQIETRIAALTVWVGDDRVGEWAGNDDATVVAWAIPQRAADPPRTDVGLQLRMSPTWQQIRPWSLELPGAIREVIVENSKGISIGTARAPKLSPPPAGLVLQAHNVASAPRFLALGAVDFGGEQDKDAKAAWRDLGGDQPNGIGRWLWTLSPSAPSGGKALEYLASTNGCGDLRVSCSAEGTFSCLRPVCFVDRYGRLIGTSCPQNKRRSAWNEDERRYRPVHAPSCCSEVMRCD
jgi:hypothetical protein